MTDNHKKRRNYLIATIILGSIVIFAIMYFFSPTSQITQGNPAENFQKKWTCNLSWLLQYSV